MPFPVFAQSVPYDTGASCNIDVPKVESTLCNACIRSANALCTIVQTCVQTCPRAVTLLMILPSNSVWVSQHYSSRLHTQLPIYLPVVKIGSSVSFAPFAPDVLVGLGLREDLEMFRREEMCPKV